MNIEQTVARDLLSIQAVFFRPEQPFTWASGIKSPVYCDNRLILTAPAVRDRMWSRPSPTLMKKEYPDCRGAHGHLHRRYRPRGHRRPHSGPAHGLCALRRQGPRPAATRSRAAWRQGQKVVVVEDLISTGGSVLEVVDVLRQAGAEVLGVVSIFTYGMQKGLDRLARGSCEERQPDQLRRRGPGRRRGELHQTRGCAAADRLPQRPQSTRAG